MRRGKELRNTFLTKKKFFFSFLLNIISFFKSLNKWDLTEHKVGWGLAVSHGYRWHGSNHKLHGSLRGDNATWKHEKKKAGLPPSSMDDRPRQWTRSLSDGQDELNREKWRFLTSCQTQREKTSFILCVSLPQHIIYMCKTITFHGLKWLLHYLTESKNRSFLYLHYWVSLPIY